MINSINWSEYILNCIDILNIENNYENKLISEFQRKIWVELREELKNSDPDKLILLLKELRKNKK